MIDKIMNIGGLISDIIGLAIEVLLFLLFTVVLVVVLGYAYLYGVYLFG
jgi:hypothetical protein